MSADGSFPFDRRAVAGHLPAHRRQAGFATESRDVELGAAQELEGIKVVLREGDGVIAGHVDSPAGPLGGVDIVATSGDLEFPTVSLTLDDVGALHACARSRRPAATR